MKTGDAASLNNRVKHSARGAARSWQRMVAPYMTAGYFMHCVYITVRASVVEKSSSLGVHHFRAVHIASLRFHDQRVAEILQSCKFPGENTMYE